MTWRYCQRCQAGQCQVSTVSYPDDTARHPASAGKRRSSIFVTSLNRTFIVIFLIARPIRLFFSDFSSYFFFPQSQSSFTYFSHSIFLFLSFLVSLSYHIISFVQKLLSYTLTTLVLSLKRRRKKMKEKTLKIKHTKM